MRFVLALLLLIALMAAAGLWQERWTDEARHKRDVLFGRASSSEDGAPGPRLVLGRPSGREPFDVPVGPPREAPPRPSPSTVAPPPVSQDTSTAPLAAYEPAPWEPVFELEVQPGKVLSVLCEEFYGTSRPPVVQRVAEWNQLASPDQLKVGQRIELPAKAWVLGEGP